MTFLVVAVSNSTGDETRWGPFHSDAVAQRTARKWQRLDSENTDQDEPENRYHVEYLPSQRSWERD